MNYYDDDVIADQQTRAFFEQAVRDGRMTQAEFNELYDNRGSREKTLRTYEAFVEDAARLMDMTPETARTAIETELKARRLKVRHAELWINYPNHTEHELAAAFHMPRRTVAYQLHRIRESWPSLRLELPMRGRDEAPALRNMKRIETTANSDDRLNDQEVTKL